MPRTLQDLSPSKKIAYLLVVAVVFSSFWLWMYLDYRYARTGPHVPQPEIGRVYSLESYGIPAYVTHKGKLLLQLAFWTWCGSVSALVMLAAGVFDKWRSNRRR
jgi:hypothetical protein